MLAFISSNMSISSFLVGLFKFSLIVFSTFAVIISFYVVLINARSIK